MIYHSSYLSYAFHSPERYKENLDIAVSRVQRIQEKYKFQAIAFTGVSGSALAFPISYMTGIPLICIRKPKIKSHSHAIAGVEMSASTNSIRKYAVIDDVIDTGDTFNKIKKAVRQKFKDLGMRPPKCSVVMCMSVYEPVWKQVPVKSLLYDDLGEK